MISNISFPNKKANQKGYEMLSKTHMKLDNLSVGEVDGIGGGLCNLVYFNKSLNSKNIYYIYNTVKNKTPPIVDDNKENILFNK
jgi:hypothetical protein